MTTVYDWFIRGTTNNKVVVHQTENKKTEINKLLDAHNVLHRSTTSRPSGRDGFRVAIVTKDYWISHMQSLPSLPQNWRIISDQVMLEILRGNNKTIWNESKHLKTLKLTEYKFHLIGDNDATRKYLQLHNADVEKPRDSKTLTSNETWYILPYNDNKRSSTLRVLQLKCSGIANIINKEFMDNLKSTWDPVPIRGAIFEGLRFLFLEKNDPLLGIVGEKGGEIVDTCQDGCIVVYNGISTPTMDVETLLSVKPTKNVILSSGWIREMINKSPETPILQPLQNYTHEYVKVPHPSIHPKASSFKYAMYPRYTSRTNQDFSEDFDEIIPPEGLTVVDIEKTLTDCQISKMSSIKDAHVLICGDVHRINCTTSYSGKHPARLTCIEQVIQEGSGHECHWTHQPFWIGNEQENLLKDFNCVVLLDEKKQNLVVNGIRAMGGTPRKIREIRHDADEMIITEKEPCLSFEGSVALLSNMRVQIIKPEYIVNICKDGDTEIDAYLISAKERQSWLTGHSWTVNTGTPLEVAQQLQPTHTPQLVSSQAGATSQLIVNNEVRDMLSEANEVIATQLPVPDHNQATFSSQANDDEPVIIPSDSQNSDASSCFFLLDSVSMSRTVEYFVNKLKSLNLKLGAPQISFKGTYPMLNQRDLIPYVEPLLPDDVQENSGILNSFTESNNERHIVIAGLWKGSNVASCHTWVTRAGQLIVNILHSFGVCAEHITVDNNTSGIVASLDISKDPKCFMEFKTHTHDQISNIIAFSTTMAGLNVLKYTAKHSDLAHPHAYVFCGSRCVCNLRKQLSTEFLIGRRSPIRVFFAHEKNKYIEVGTQLLMDADTDGLKYKILTKSADEIFKITELTYDNLRKILTEIDKTLEDCTKKPCNLCEKCAEFLDGKHYVKYKPFDAKTCVFCAENANMYWFDQKLLNDVVMDESV